MGRAKEWVGGGARGGYHCGACHTGTAGLVIEVYRMVIKQKKLEGGGGGVLISLLLLVHVTEAR